MPPPIGGGAAAGRIAAALGTSNVIGEKAAVTTFVVLRFVGGRAGLLLDGDVGEADGEGVGVVV
ncbi:hypothetical protein OZK63_39310, partial [Streptomyces sp. UMAF16]|nr:hypothetical protein [Streptomyces sp. UMAF16]